MLLLLLSRFSCVRLCATPWIAAYQALPSTGFSRLEYQSGLPFLLQRIFLTQVLNPGLPHCRQTLYCLSHQEGNNWSWQLFPSPGELPHPGIEPMSPVSPALAGGFFTTEPLEASNLLQHQLYSLCSLSNSSLTLKNSSRKMRLFLFYSQAQLKCPGQSGTQQVLNKYFVE